MVSQLSDSLTDFPTTRYGAATSLLLGNRHRRPAIIQRIFVDDALPSIAECGVAGNGQAGACVPFLSGRLGLDAAAFRVRL